MDPRNFILVLFAIIEVSEGGTNIEEEQYGVRYATDCEVCKLVAKEVGERLQSRDSSGVIETGYNIDGSKKKTKYNKSELRLVETLEEVCGGMLDYRIHKERQDSTRWAKRMSQTFETLHNLVNKGVKVDLGIPMELWDEPSAEVAHLKTQCEQFIEDYEDNITSWYFGDQMKTLHEVVCKKILQNKKCLGEPYGEEVPNEETTAENGKNKSKGKNEKDTKRSKGDKGKRSKSEL